MTNLFSKSWESSEIKQNRLIKDVDRLLSLLEKQNKTIVIIQEGEPSQSDWEAEWLSEGYDLPILPGAKLVWINPILAVNKLFTTAYDTNNGASTSGAIYEFQNSAATRQPIRHLGFGKTSHLSNGAVGIARTPNRPLFLTDLKHWAEQGLNSLVVFYRQKRTGTGETLRIHLLKRNNSDSIFTTTTVTEITLKDLFTGVPTNSELTAATTNSAVATSLGLSLDVQAVVFITGLTALLDSNDNGLITRDGLSIIAMSTGAVHTAKILTSQLTNYSGLRILATQNPSPFIQDADLDVYGIFDEKTAAELVEAFSDKYR